MMTKLRQIAGRLMQETGESVDVDIEKAAPLFLFTIKQYQFTMRSQELATQAIQDIVEAILDQYLYVTGIDPPGKPLDPPGGVVRKAVR